MSIFNFFRKKKNLEQTDNSTSFVQPVNLQIETIKRQVEILTESIQMVNDSNNLV